MSNTTPLSGNGILQVWNSWSQHKQIQKSEYSLDPPSLHSLTFSYNLTLKTGTTTNYHRVNAQRLSLYIFASITVISSTVHQVTIQARRRPYSLGNIIIYLYDGEKYRQVSIWKKNTNRMSLNAVNDMTISMCMFETHYRS